MRRYFFRYDFLFQRRTSLIFANSHAFARKRGGNANAIDTADKEDKKMESLLSKVNF